MIISQKLVIDFKLETADRILASLVSMKSQIS